MEIKFGKKTLRIDAYDGCGENVKTVKIDGAINQNFENAIKTFLATFDINEYEIVGGQVNLQFNFMIK